MRWLSGLVTAAISLSSVGCMHAEFVTQAKPGVSHTLNNPFFLWGLVGDNTFDADRLCPKGVASIDAYETFGDGFLSGITLGIYTPRTVEITCAADAGVERHYRIGDDGTGTWRVLGNFTTPTQSRMAHAPTANSNLHKVLP